MRILPLFSVFFMLPLLTACPEMLDIGFSAEREDIKNGSHIPYRNYPAQTPPAGQLSYIPMYYDADSGQHMPYADTYLTMYPKAKIVYVPMYINPQTGTQTPVDQNLKMVAGGTNVPLVPQAYMPKPYVRDASSDW
jgi:hypothetical protein